jgi:nickel/cobalt exporter
VIRARGLLILLAFLALATITGQPPARAEYSDSANDRSQILERRAPGRSPFAIAGGESAGAATGFAAVVLSWQNKFHVELQGAIRKMKSDGAAFWTLAAASFAYGVFHAAGPGHGKMVLASYMIASRIALRRGMLLAWLAALLQGAVAIGLVGGTAALLNATAVQMRGVADAVEIASYGVIALLGAALVWKKGAAFLASLQVPVAPAKSPSGIFCEAVDDPAHMCSPSCGHAHAVDPAVLEQGFSFAGAIGAVVAAGLRPCTGAILILVFTLAQGMFWAGAAAVLLMAGGTAITTGALAATAVFARQTAQKWNGAGWRWASILGRGAELAAALLVLGVGLTLLAGASQGQGA